MKKSSSKAGNYFSSLGNVYIVIKVISVFNGYPWIRDIINRVANPTNRAAYARHSNAICSSEP